MRIGIDISQTAYQKTGVANFLIHLVEHLIKIDNNNRYILFFSSFGKNIPSRLLKLEKNHQNIEFKTFKFPLRLLEFMWNKLHVYPIEWFVGEVDIFITSDWLEPPASSAKKATILYDVIAYKYPQETDKKIIEVQKGKLQWVKKESDLVLCISQATKKDAIEILGIPQKKLKVVYPGI